MPPSPSLSTPPNPQPPPVYPLYNTTYTLHRLSPLHSFPPSSLPSHATALSEILTGSTLRGVRIGLDTSDVSLSRAGALRGVSMRPLRSPEGWESVYAAVELEETVGVEGEGGDGGWGVIIEITYEKANYTALLLRDITSSPATADTTTSTTEGGFTHLPLLLTRLPPPLRATLLDFLSTRFDTHASAMQLSSPFLKKALGGYMDALIAGGGDVRGGVRDVVISLAFPSTGAGGAGGAGEGGGGLKGIDVTISRDDVTEFLERGRNTTTAATTTTTTSTTTAGGADEHPFWNALHTYTTKHLALDMHNPEVAVVKIACGAFVMASEGRVKISAPTDGGRGERGEREGAEGVVGMLVAAAGRTG